MATYRCSNCGKTVNVPDWLNTELKCPSCRAIIPKANSAPAAVAQSPAVAPKPPAPVSPVAAPAATAAPPTGNTRVQPAPLRSGSPSPAPRSWSRPAFLFFVLLGAACLLVWGFRDRVPGFSGPQSTSRTSSKIASRRLTPNEEAWHKVLRSDGESTFRDARFVLSELDLSAVTDPDLKDLIEYQSKLCNFCITIGLPKKHGATVRETLATIDYRNLAWSLMDKGISKVMDEAVRLGDEGLALYSQVGRYEELRAVLARRYAVGR